MMHAFLIDLYHVTIRHLPELRFDKNNEVHRTLISLYSTIIELTNAALHIRQAGGYTGMDILLRSVLEAHVDLINLANDGGYLRVMVAAYHKEWIKLADDGVKGENPFLAYFKDSPEALEKLQHHRAQLAELKKSGHIPTNLEKFQWAGMEHEYRSIYNSLCNESHNNLRALTSRHFRENEDGSLDLVIFDTPTREDLAATLDTFIATLNTSNRIMHHYFKSKPEVADELDHFRRVREEKGLSWVEDLEV
ncbi:MULTISPECIES: DUF5677 domain-containing protein [Rhizobium/Agrobacterium group]|uniref:DUF5677 domain-containing protein n=1 Tax=Rhizobium/Agrobacterium group TaxID=227290 RepID=UPI0005142DD0|nr:MULTISPECIES: DUF5677 domain-containing protein [Rhizobium/Agrobacterium group]ANV25573.1 hypothetical protein BA939_16230 [Rhizobium sp. S41]KGE80279.1 hypothetical protein LW14_24060 [Rhizobium sp. H41]MDG3580253.1 DUF5677 domain-containing protein [Rhizobium sp. YJ-22]QWW77670.1 hypothetical protein KP800_26445 [Agrobacterium pusense]